jgi:membrane protein
MKAISGFEFTGVVWKAFVKRLYDRIFDADIFSRAAQVAFFFSFALFPLLYFLVSLFGMVLESSEGLRIELFTYLRRIMPRAVFELVSKTVAEIVQNSSGGKLTLGLIVTLWSASAGVDAIRTALNDVYKLKETRNWFRTRAQSLLLTVIVAVLVAIVLAIVFYGWQLFEIASAEIGFRVSSPVILVIIQWVSILLVMLLACEVIYNLLPDFKDFTWIWITPGSLVAIFLWLVLTNVLRFYLGYFDTYDKAYGSLGAVMIMMLWLYLTALALMIGGAINAILHELRIEHRLAQEPVELNEEQAS